MMEKSRVIAAALIAAFTVTSVHAFTWPSMSRKGEIDSAAVEPTSPTTAAPVILRISVQDHLVLDKVETRQFFTTFIIKIYWKEPPAASSASGPTLHQESLGTLDKGKYRILLQSYCEGRLADSAQISFEVKEASTPGSGSTLDDVWVTPQVLTTASTATVHVTGHWPTAGYSRPIAMIQHSGRMITINLHWNRPKGAVAQVVTPYDYEAPVRLISAGTYTVRVFVHLDGQKVDAAEITFEVTPGSNGGWPWGFGNY